MANGAHAVLFDRKSILITGGTGSLGKVLVRRILGGEMGTPKKVIVFSRDEAKQHAMRLTYLHKKVSTDEAIYRNFSKVLEFRIGDVRDYAAVCSAVKTADIIVNAAALKQVPSCEYFPGEAMLTNCMGAANIVRAISENGYPVNTVVAGQHRQGVQAGQRDGHDQSAAGADFRRGQHPECENALHRRALRQRAGVARLGGPALS
jgi:FlaA1/EpsC-like NDP-sugar epimerase